LKLFLYSRNFLPTLSFESIWPYQTTPKWQKIFQIVVFFTFFRRIAPEPAKIPLKLGYRVTVNRRKTGKTAQVNPQKQPFIEPFNNFSY
jgi:hypothetical protein